MHEDLVFYFAALMMVGGFGMMAVAVIRLLMIGRAHAEDLVAPIASIGWVGARHWPAAAASADQWDGTLEHLLNSVEVAVAGVDGSGLDDLLGVAIVGRLRADPGTWLLWSKAWAQPDFFERRDDISEHLETFLADEALIRCSDASQDLVEVADLLGQVRLAGVFPDELAIGLDPQIILSLIDELSARGFTDDQMVSVPQGFHLTAAVRSMERKLANGTLVHSGQSLMDWCVGNAKAEQRGNAVVITEAEPGTTGLNPLVAVFNAVSLMSRNPQACAASA